MPTIGWFLDLFLERLWENYSKIYWVSLFLMYIWYKIQMYAIYVCQKSVSSLSSICIITCLLFLFTKGEWLDKSFFLNYVLHFLREMLIMSSIFWVNQYTKFIFIICNVKIFKSHTLSFILMILNIYLFFYCLFYLVFSVSYLELIYILGICIKILAKIFPFLFLFG